MDAVFKGSIRPRGRRSVKKFGFFFRHQRSAGLMPPVIVTEGQVRVMGGDVAQARAQLTFWKRPGFPSTCLQRPIQTQSGWDPGRRGQVEAQLTGALACPSGVAPGSFSAQSEDPPLLWGRSPRQAPFEMWRRSRDPTTCTLSLLLRGPVTPAAFAFLL